ncbi:AMP-dependent synthetase/ligase [Micrococcoides hystricis]|uniref:Acyl-CoA synthetase n=1 Tax=Micrococcoides hystricis TaxID=1572761 RepID=A0ABV6P6Q1_9MICC
MQEIFVDEGITVAENLSTPDLLLERVAASPESPLFARQSGPGEWTDVSTQEFYDDVTAIAKGLVAQRFNPGDKILIMAPTQYEWTLVDFAVWFAGGVVVPVYETSSPSQVGWIMTDSGAKGAFYADERHGSVIRQAIKSENYDRLTDMWQMTDTGLDELRKAGSNITDGQLRSRYEGFGLKDLATIIYTSGTLGKPKGCEITHGNFVELSKQTLTSLGHVVNESSSTVLFIPLAHVFARFISVLCVAAGAKVGHTADIKDLVDDLQSFKPEFLLAVPRVFEKVYNAAKAKAEDGGKGKIFSAGEETAIAYSKASAEGHVPFGLKLKHALFNKILFGKIKEAMGGRVEYAVSGGAPLGKHLGHFFYGIGVKILEGYGLTETTAPVTVNTPDRIKIGTVGRPLLGCGVRIAEDGEVLAKGVCVFRGYHNIPELDSESFTEDGWFRTGDMGELDQEGFLTITGRKKELIVTAGGKNVAPAQLEDQIRADALVAQAMVVGNEKPFIAAVVTLDPETLPGWLGRNGIDANTPIEELTEHPKVLAHIQKLVDKANDSVSRAEQIRKFVVLADDLSVESGHLTPSLKLRRANVVKDYEDVIESLYANGKNGAANKGSAEQ